MKEEMAYDGLPFPGAGCPIPVYGLIEKLKHELNFFWRHIKTSRGVGRSWVPFQYEGRLSE